MKHHHSFTHRSLSAICVLGLLFGSSAAWSQTQIKKTFAVHGSTTLSTPDFGKGVVTETVTDAGKAFVDIAFGAGPDNLLAASGTELWLYPSSEGPADLVHDFSLNKMRSILAIAVDPNTEMAYVFAETKGKPTFKLLIGNKNLDNPPYWSFSGDVIQEEFPKFVDAVAVEGGVLAADEKAIYLLEAPDYSAVRIADKKFIGLLGPESITGVAVIPDSGIVLVGTDRRRLLSVDLSTGTVAPFGGETPLAAVEPCVSDRDQIIGVAAGRTGENAAAVIVTDFACDEVRLFDDAGTAQATLQGAEGADPQDPATTEGEVFDLDTCFTNPGGCDFAPLNTAKVYLSRLPTGPSEAVLRQVTGMTDPRCADANGPVLEPLYLNERLPEEVRNLGIVPDPMYVPAWLQGDKEYDCKFGAFIVTTNPDTRTGIVDASWEIRQLLGVNSPSRCDTGLGRVTDPNIDAILDWDTIAHSPTRGDTVCADCGASPVGFEVTLANVGCGSTKGSARGFSVFLYGLAIPNSGPDTLVNVTDLLLTDLGTAIDELAGPLLSTADQMLLQNRYLNLMDKWSKAYDAFLNQPNSADTTLNAVVAQLGNLKYENEFEVTYCPDGNDCDEFNIQGEISVRTEVLLFLINERLAPSIPLNGLPLP